jgi:hypothetical protein
MQLRSPAALLLLLLLLLLCMPPGVPAGPSKRLAAGPSAAPTPAQAHSTATHAHNMRGCALH